MNKQDKQLVFQDLCARLPHHIRVKVWLKDGTTEEGVLDLEHNYGDVLRDAFYYNKIKDIKPYLRPMPSMTEEEKNKFESISNCEIDCNNGFDNSCYPYTEYGYISNESIVATIDWLNAHHFDYRGLIPKGLAIEVTKENNPYL